jgi:hypothetical protein
MRPAFVGGDPRDSAVTQSVVFGGIVAGITRFHELRNQAGGAAPRSPHNSTATALHAAITAPAQQLHIRPLA